MTFSFFGFKVVSRHFLSQTMPNSDPSPRGQTLIHRSTTSFLLCVIKVFLDFQMVLDDVKISLGFATL